MDAFIKYQSVGKTTCSKALQWLNQIYITHLNDSAVGGIYKE